MKHLTKYLVFNWVLIILDETQIRYAHAAKCLNESCNSPVSIPWKKNCQLVIKQENDKINKTSQDGGECEQNGVDIIQNGESINNEEISNENGLNSEQISSNVVKCKECGTKFDEKHIETFVKAMEVTHGHLQSMSGAAVACILSLFNCID